MAPGRYTPDASEGITRVEDLPLPRVRSRSALVGSCVSRRSTATRYRSRSGSRRTPWAVTNPGRTRDRGIRAGRTGVVDTRRVLLWRG